MSREFLSKVGLGIIMFSVYALLFLEPAMVVVSEIVFVALRLFGFIDWSWMWVIIWAPLLLSIALLLLCLVFYFCGKVLLVLSTLGKKPCEETQEDAVGKE